MDMYLIIVLQKKNIPRLFSDDTDITTVKMHQELVQRHGDGRNTQFVPFEVQGKQISL